MKYDAIIIGSGQAGNPLARSLADLGWTVALIEEAYLGGTCINTGCTPTKTMIHRAQVAHYARASARWGINAEKVRVDLASIVAQKNRVVESFREGQQKNVARRPNLHLHRGHARFVNSRRLSVGSEILDSEKIFINTGGRPSIPDIPGLNNVGFLTSESIMELTAPPEHLLILGAGYIGLEFGQMFCRFGSRVTIIHRGGQILPREDQEVAAELQKALEAEGVEFLLNCRTTKARMGDSRIILDIEGNQAPFELSGTHLLVAAGRRPNADDLGLENAGVEVDERGFIKTDSRLRTSVEGIWALGDVKGGPAFTHVSYNDFQIVFANLTGSENLSTDDRLVPYCVFTDPQLGRVGMTEREAKAAGRRLKVGSIPMSWVARAIERDEIAGLMKIVVDAENDRILGAAILGSEGGETIHVLSTLILTRSPYTVLKGAIYIHPTLAEGLFTLLENVKPI